MTNFRTFFSMRNLIRLFVGLPVGLLVVAGIVQTPKVWMMLEGDPRRFMLALLQGGLPVLPFVFFAISIWFAADMTARMNAKSAIGTPLASGLTRSGLGLILGGLAFAMRHSDWAWRDVYNNITPQHPGLMINFTLLSLVFGLIGGLMIVAGWRIRRLQAAHEHLQQEMEHFI